MGKKLNELTPPLTHAAKWQQFAHHVAMNTMGTEFPDREEIKNMPIRTMCHPVELDVTVVVCNFQLQFNQMIEVKVLITVCLSCINSKDICHEAIAESGINTNIESATDMGLPRSSPLPL